MVQEATWSSRLCAGLCAGLTVLGHGHAQTWAVPVLCLGLPAESKQYGLCRAFRSLFFCLLPL